MIAARSRRIGQRYHIGDEDKTSPDYRWSYSAGRLTSDGGRCCRAGGEDRIPRRERVLQTTTKRVPSMQRTLAESTDRTVRTSFPAIGRCCGLCGEKEHLHFPAERERGCTASRHIESRYGEDPRLSRADGTCIIDTAWNEL